MMEALSSLCVYIANFETLCGTLCLYLKVRTFQDTNISRCEHTRYEHIKIQYNAPGFLELWPGFGCCPCTQERTVTSWIGLLPCTRVNHSAGERAGEVQHPPSEAAVDRGWIRRPQPPIAAGAARRAGGRREAPLGRTLPRRRSGGGGVQQLLVGAAVSAALFGCGTDYPAAVLAAGKIAAGIAHASGAPR